MSTDPRRQPPEVRREQLLDAAQGVLLRQGPSAMTMAEVADVAGLAKGTTYLYFPSKDDLLAELRARYLNRYLEAVVSAEVSSKARKRLKRLMTGLVEFGRANAELHHRLFHEAGFPEEDAFLAVRELLENLLRQGSATGELDVDDVTTTASFLLHGAHGVLIQHELTAKAGARKVADLVDRCVKPT